MMLHSKKLATLWEKHPIGLFVPVIIFTGLSAIMASVDNPFLSVSVSLFLFFTGLYLALYINASIGRGYISSERIYTWESPFNFWGVCMIYGFLSLSLMLGSILVLLKII